MIDNILSKWERLPTWGKWVCGIAVVLVFSALGPTLHERHFFSAFVGNLSALVLHNGLVIGGFVWSIWGRVKVAEKTYRNWIGWVCGIAIFALVGGTGNDLERLPIGGCG